MKYSIGPYGVMQAEGKWPTTDRGALAESIRKWRAVIRLKAANDGSIATCALCQLHYPVYTADRERGDCENCPIRKVTGLPFCVDTPYGWPDMPAREGAELTFLESLYAQLYGYWPPGSK